MLNTLTSTILNLFSINTTFFTILNYPLSYIEFFGTIFYLWSVWLIARKKILTWPIGIISVILYGILFYQIQLYSDTLEQIYYLGASVYGWWFWKKNVLDTKTSIKIRLSEKKHIITFVIITLILSLMLGYFMTKVHLLLPKIFTEPASYPYLDAITTIMSFTAMFLMAQKRIESWIYWIIVDVIGIGLYYAKDVKFISLLYVILLFMAINGLIIWLKDIKQTDKKIKTVKKNKTHKKQNSLTAWVK